MKMTLNLGYNPNLLAYRLFVMSLFKDFLIIERAFMTGVEFYRPFFKSKLGNVDVKVSYPHYGHTVVRDSLCSMEKPNSLIAIGACGSLKDGIDFGDYVIPSSIHTGYLKRTLRDKEFVFPDEKLFEIIYDALSKMSRNKKIHREATGTVPGVFNDETELETCTHRYYGRLGEFENICAIECEGAEALYYAEENRVPAVAVFYVSDAPSMPFDLNSSDRKTEAERNRTCRKLFRELNKCALEILKTS